MQEVIGSTPIFSTNPASMRDFSFMGFTVYIIYSSGLDKYYVGQTENLEDRLFRHNNSGSKSTKSARDWVLSHVEVFETRIEAVKREQQIKKKKSRKYVESIISSSG